jgi:hypothetical protein
LDLSPAGKAELVGRLENARIVCHCTESAALSLARNAVNDVKKKRAVATLSKWKHRATETINPHLPALKTAFDGVLTIVPLLGRVKSKDHSDWDTIDSSKAPEEIQKEQVGVSVCLNMLGRKIAEMRILHCLDMKLPPADKVELRHFHSKLKEYWRWHDDVANAGEPDKRGLGGRVVGGQKGAVRTVFTPASRLICKVRMCARVSAGNVSSSQDEHTCPVSIPASAHTRFAVSGLARQAPR